MAIIHIETFVTFNFNPPLPQDRLLTPIWTESNEFSGIYWWIIELQNCIDAIAEIFDLIPQSRKTCYMRFFFLSGIFASKLKNLVKF